MIDWKDPYEELTVNHLIVSKAPQVIFLSAVGGHEDCHNPCNVNLSQFYMGVWETYMVARVPILIDA